MKITAPYRGRRAVKRLDLTDMRAAFRDTRIWCSVGIVTDPGDGPHFEVLADDVHVEVVLQPALVPVTCRLSASLWRIPDIGEEVVVQIFEGELDFMPTITDVLSSGKVPQAQGPALGRIVITRGEVVVHDGTGGAVELAKASELNTLAQTYNTHVHSVTVTGTATTQSGVTLVTTATQADQPGTSVLKGA